VTTEERRQRAAAAMLALLLTACGLSSRPSGHPTPTQQPPTMIDTTALPPDRAARALEAWAHHRATWEAHHGQPAPRPTFLVVEPGDYLADPAYPSGTSGWLTWHPDGSTTVRLALGAHDTLPSAHHELCHLAFLDPAHADPRWQTTWLDAQLGSVLALMGRRSP